MLKEEIRELFEEVLDAYVVAESDATLNSFSFDETGEDQDVYDDEYKYSMSRINTKADEWREELRNLLDG